jgi:hypothetical protein
MRSATKKSLQGLDSVFPSSATMGSFFKGYHGAFVIRITDRISRHGQYWIKPGAYVCCSQGILMPRTNFRLEPHIAGERKEHHGVFHYKREPTQKALLHILRLQNQAA